MNSLVSLAYSFMCTKSFTAAMSHFTIIVYIASVIAFNEVITLAIMTAPRETFKAIVTSISVDFLAMQA
jgi:hypothetical protein